MSLRCGGSRLKKAVLAAGGILLATVISGSLTITRADYYDAYGYYHPDYGWYDIFGNYYTDYGYYDIFGNFYSYVYSYPEPEISEDGLRAVDPYGYLEYVPLFYPADVRPELVKKTEASIAMDWIGQNPEMPNGCEIVASATVLNYCGFDIDRFRLGEDYFLQEEKKLDFRKYYIGNPFDYTGIGCWSGAVIRAVNQYLDTQDTKLHAFDYTNYLFEDLLNQVADGYPVIIWATQKMDWPHYGLRFPVDDEDLVYISPEHCLVLNGYDLEKRIVQAADPLEGQVDYDMDLFKKRFIQLGSQAVIIKSPEAKFEEDRDIISWPFNDRFLPPEKIVRGCKGFDGVSEAD